MSIDPVRYIVLPRVVALSIMCPLLTAFTDMIGILGGDAGELVAWKQSVTEFLSIPTSAQVIDLAYSSTWGALSGLPKASTDAPQQTASWFAPGLLCATDNDGLWVLRSMYPVEWLHISELDGLPSDQLLHVALDDSANVWLGTRAGIAKLDLQLQVSHWPQDPYLSQRALTLFKGPSSHVYAGWWGGLFRIVTVPYDDELHKTGAPLVEPLPGIDEAILSTCWASALWWTAGDSLVSFLGATLHPPTGMADNSVLCIARHEDAIWLGHPAGQMSRVQTEPGQNGLPSFETWQHFSPQDGLPHSNLNCLWFHDGTLFVGSGAGLYQQSGLGTGPSFQTVDQLPPEDVRTQATWRGSHWVGGEAGLWESDGSGWWQIPLWPGASEVQSISATAETLWVTAGMGGIAARVGNSWTVPQRHPSLAVAAFADVAVSNNGIAYAATNVGVAFINNHLVAPLTPASPPDVQRLLWHDASLFVGTPLGLYRWTPGRNWQNWTILDGLPGSDVQAIAAAPAPFILLGTAQGAGFFPVALQPTDVPSDTHDLAASKSAATNICLIASRQGNLLRVPIPHEDATSMRLYDIRGRYLNEWRSDEPGFLVGRATTHNGQRLGTGLYFGRFPTKAGAQTVRVLVTP
jgi:hypothetical protein